MSDNGDLEETGQTLTWMIWGEREVTYKVFSEDNEKLQPLWSAHKHIHRQSKVYMEKIK